MQAKTLFDFLMRLTRDYFSREYFYYYEVQIPEKKDEALIEEKLKQVYEITHHYEIRRRRKLKGEANCNVVIYNKKAIIVATEGIHAEVEAREFKDIRKTPLEISGYEIFISGYIKGGIPKATVRITPARYQKISKQVNQIGLHNKQKLIDYFNRLSPYSFSAINQQKFTLLRKVNKRRSKAGLPRIEWEKPKPYWTN